MSTLEKRLREILGSFKSEIKKAQDEALDKVYCELIPEYYEDELIQNIRTNTIHNLVHSDKRKGFNWKEIRKKILEENKEDITNEIISELMEENKQLKEQIEEAYE